MMLTHKTLAIAGLGVAFLLTPLMTGCATSAGDSGDTTAQSDDEIRAPGFPAVMSREPGSVAADYHTEVAHMRLLGTTMGDGASWAYATLANKGSWSTTNVHVGDLVGRNYKVAAITPDGIDLQTKDGAQHLATGADLDLHLFHHRFDTAATYLGKHAYTLDGQAMHDLAKHYGAGVQADEQTATPPAEVGLGPQTTVTLTSVDPRGVFGRAGFKVGDVLLAVDGTTLHGSDLGALASRLATPAGGRVTVTVAEHGARHPIVFDVR